MISLVISPAYSIDFAELNIAAFTSQNWRLEGIHLSVKQQNQTHKLSLTIKKLTLPKPFDDIHFVNVSCARFTWQAGQINCQQGYAQLHSKRWHSPEADFAFAINDNHSVLTLNKLKVAGGTVVVKAQQHEKRWQLELIAKNIATKQLKQYIPRLPVDFKNGNATVNLLASGQETDITQVKLTTDVNQLQLQTVDGLIASEKLAVHTELTANQQQGIWAWQQRSHFNNGALYVDPIYVAVDSKPIVIEAKGLWDSHKKHITVHNIHYQHPDNVIVTGKGVIDYKKTVSVAQADLSIQSLKLNNVLTVYVKPFFDPLLVDGVSASGQATSHVVINQHALTDASLNFDQLTVKDKDKARRLQLKQGVGILNWTANPLVVNNSHIAWQQLNLFKVPINAAQLTLNSWGKNLRLLQPAKLPCLGGFITVNQFSWQGKPDGEPDIVLAGNIDHVSLEKLTQVLQWTPLSGTISGHIPGVHYHDKTLHLGGELSIDIFDGVIKLTNLASAKLFSEFPIVYSDFEVTNLDLDQLTRKFAFGNITGRLSGSVKKLTLENWQPTQFFAWFGTPEGDDSSHRISQKAVNNIARIGGNAATDLLSRSFLGMFETFGYDKIGIGCYLYNGVCQMMGVETTEQGYYLIKGGGLPRIDVLGYNAKVDWPVLVERLKRLSDSDSAIVE